MSRFRNLGVNRPAISVDSYITLALQEQCEISIGPSPLPDLDRRVQVRCGGRRRFALRGRLACRIDQAKVLCPLIVRNLLVAQSRRHESPAWSAVTPRLESEAWLGRRRTRFINSRSKTTLLVFLCAAARTRIIS